MLFVRMSVLFVWLNTVLQVKHWNIRCDCTSGNNDIRGNNKYKSWPRSQFKKLVFLLFPLKSNTDNEMFIIMLLFAQRIWRGSSSNNECIHVQTWCIIIFLYMAFPLSITLFIIHITRACHVKDFSFKIHYN